MVDSPCVVLVDAYAPSRHLVPAFQQAGASCIRVQSTPQVPRVYRELGVSVEGFVENIVHDGDLNATVNRLQHLEPVAVLAAGESGVELSDLLSAALGVPSNGTRLSAARRDKYLMVEAARESGLTAARQLLVEDADQLRQWHAALGGRVVLKPTRSAAGAGVAFCDTPADSVRAYLAMRGVETVFSEPNSGVVAQEYLVGPEYIIDTVSRDGAHHVCDIWRTTRISLNGIPDLLDGMYLQTRHGEAQEALVEYCIRLLDALEITHGLAHLEVKLTPSGPCLVEIGARMAGADVPYYAQQALGESQLDWVVRSYLRPEEFHSRCPEPYRVRQFFAHVPMLSTREGVLRAYADLGQLERLESFHEIRQAVGPGDRLHRTVDDLTIPLAVNLMHPVEEIVYRDSRTARYLDGRSFYELEQQP